MEPATFRRKNLTVASYGELRLHYKLELILIVRLSRTPTHTTAVSSPEEIPGPHQTFATRKFLPKANLGIVTPHHNTLKTFTKMSQLEGGGA
jgi:hypothetical protein